MSKIEVDEVLCFCDVVISPLCKWPPLKWGKNCLMRTVSDKAAEVPANYAMPCGALFRVELKRVRWSIEGFMCGGSGTSRLMC